MIIFWISGNSDSFFVCVSTIFEVRVSREFPVITLKMTVKRSLKSDTYSSLGGSVHPLSFSLLLGVKWRAERLNPRWMAREKCREEQISTILRIINSISLLLMRQDSEAQCLSLSSKDLFTFSVTMVTLYPLSSVEETEELYTLRKLSPTIFHVSYLQRNTSSLSTLNVWVVVLKSCSASTLNTSSSLGVLLYPREVHLSMMRLPVRGSSVYSMQTGSSPLQPRMKSCPLCNRAWVEFWCLANSTTKGCLFIANMQLQSLGKLVWFQLQFLICCTEAKEKKHLRLRSRIQMEWQAKRRNTPEKTSMQKSASSKLSTTPDSRGRDDSERANWREYSVSFPTILIPSLRKSLLCLMMNGSLLSLMTPIITSLDTCLNSSLIVLALGSILYKLFSKSSRSLSIFTNLALSIFTGSFWQSVMSEMESWLSSQNQLALIRCLVPFRGMITQNSSQSNTIEMSSSRILSFFRIRQVMWACSS